MKHVVAVVLLLVVLIGLSAPRASAQAQREGRLLITVVDSTGAVLPAAKVTVVGIDEITKKLVLPIAASSDKGIATIEHLVPGRYSVSGEFEGFDIGLLKDVRVKSGDNKHVLVLPLKKFAEEVTVGRDRQMVAADRGTTFGTALTREQVDALSDDPDEMARQLQDMAGPQAAIRVDSFEGQQLPPKAQIKAVHITRDSFAAENHSAGGMFIDIITQPGIGPLRAQGNFGFYDSALDGQNPLIPKKGPAQSRSFRGMVGGSLIKDKSSFSLSMSRTDSYATPNLYAQTLQGRVAENLNLRRPTDMMYVSALFDYAITKDQTMRVSYNNNLNSTENLGVGAYDFPERAFSTSNRSHYLRIQEAGPIGRRFFINSRLYVNIADSTSESAVEAPTIVVNDAYTSGGAQRRGGRHTRGVFLQSDLDYVRGINSFRTGLQIEGWHYRSDDMSNYLGTYTFGSLDAFSAGQPQTFTRRVGDPNIAYWIGQFGYYAQDDLRLRKNLTLSPGVRLEASTHLAGSVNVGPRFGVTWAPFKSGNTTLRASSGVFYDWLSTGVYEQTLRVDGLRLRQVNMISTADQPLAYPDPGTLVGLPTDRYLLGPDVKMPRNVRVSAGIEQRLNKVARVSATYENIRANGLLAGINLNAPVDGTRPDQAFVNEIQTTAQGESRAQELSLGLNLSFSPTSAVGAMTGRRFDWKRGLGIYASYDLGKATNNTDGAFSVPASGTLATEWGPRNGDVRHQVSLGVYSNALKNLSASFSMSVDSGAPYTLRLANDANGDGLFNDRPEGVGRNTLRMAGQFYSYGYFTYSIGIGKRTIALPPGITITGGGIGGYTVGTAASQPAPRYRLILQLAVNNLTNHANYAGYSGIIGGPFFMKPTSVEGVRRVNLNVGFSF